MDLSLIVCNIDLFYNEIYIMVHDTDILETDSYMQVDKQWFSGLHRISEYIYLVCTFFCSYKGRLFH